MLAFKGGFLQDWIGRFSEKRCRSPFLRQELAIAVHWVCDKSHSLYINTCSCKYLLRHASHFSAVVAHPFAPAKVPIAPARCLLLLNLSFNACFESQIPIM